MYLNSIFNDIVYLKFKRGQKLLTYFSAFEQSLPQHKISPPKNMGFYFLYSSLNYQFLYF